MLHVVELLCAPRVQHVAVLALISIGFAGCSADMSTRLSQDSFSNPFASQPEATVSVPTAPVERRELPQFARPQSLGQSTAPANVAPQSYPTARTGSSGGARGVTSNAPRGRSIETTTGSAAPRSLAANHGSRHGGTTIIVGTSDTLDTLSRHYDVSPAAILQANGYKGPRALSPGQQLIIPRLTTAAATTKSKAVAVTTATPSVHIVNRGDTMLSIARRNHVSIAELAKANNLDRSAKLKLGMKLTVPSAKTAAVTPAVQPRVGASTLALPATKLAAVTPKLQEKARLAQATTTPAELSTETPVKATEATGALPTFRWPVRGRVITSYGAKTNGKANDGINLSVPEGTPVRAAEDGVVDYSGNELKNYGNLVVVRHSKGYVTAYAHASQLLVKRGDAIKRGQIIAKSGQSGEVGSPQLHFEIRKGSSPVDPLQFLNGA